MNDTYIKIFRGTDEVEVTTAIQEYCNRYKVNPRSTSIYANSEQLRDDSVVHTIFVSVVFEYRG